MDKSDVWIDALQVVGGVLFEIHLDSLADILDLCEQSWGSCPPVLIKELIRD